MSGSMAFFWRDIQTIRGACRAAIALPHVDIGELRQVEASGSYSIEPQPPAITASEPRRLTIKDARCARTQAWHANPPSIAELFAIPILAEVEV